MTRFRHQVPRPLLNQRLARRLVQDHIDGRDQLSFQHTVSLDQDTCELFLFHSEGLPHHSREFLVPVRSPILLCQRVNLLQVSFSFQTQPKMLRQVPCGIWHPLGSLNSHLAKPLKDGGLEDRNRKEHLQTQLWREMR